MGRIRFLFVLGIAACGKVNGTPDAATSRDAPASGDAALATLIVNVTGSGTVTSDPPGIDCGTDCIEDFPIGTQVTLTASGGLTSWSGACSGSGACVVSVGGATSVGAAFGGGCASGMQTFAYTGAMQTLTRPSCVTHITVDAQGAAGGIAYYLAPLGTAGLGGRVQATIAISSGDVINVFVGGVGGDANGAAVGGGGYNGGAGGALASTQLGAGGGGASDVRVNGTGLAQRVVVAGGAGGVGAACGLAQPAGAGGGLAGADAGTMIMPCTAMTNATGGTQGAGGAGGQYSTTYGVGTPGSSGVGGAAAAATGGGGAGGGYFGGGGGSWMAGAGGSSFASAAATNVTHTQGVRAGNGTVTISW